MLDVPVTVVNCSLLISDTSVTENSRVHLCTLRKQMWPVAGSPWWSFNRCAHFKQAPQQRAHASSVQAATFVVVLDEYIFLHEPRRCVCRKCTSHLKLVKEREMNQPANRNETTKQTQTKPTRTRHGLHFRMAKSARKAVKRNTAWGKEFFPDAQYIIFRFLHFICFHLPRRSTTANTISALNVGADAHSEIS